MNYPSSNAIGRQRYAARNQSLVSYKKESHGLGPVSNTIVLIVLICILGLLYLTQVTKTNAFGYKISALKDEATSLKSEHDELEVASARLQSLDRAQNNPVSNNLAVAEPSKVIQN